MHPLKGILSRLPGTPSNSENCNSNSGVPFNAEDTLLPI
jgi:hypothetical protein